MKRNSFSSFKLVAILLSMLMFTACDKNEFTAQDALDLELQRLTREREIEAEREAFESSKDAAAHSYRKVLDSLERVNAGGLVYYDVAIVPGGGSIFGGGRAEGVSGATVTISQFGQNVAVTTDESGIASFPELRSGEVTVNVTIDGYTDMSYIANLTPDGGVANNASVYVGNVLPVFENDGANPDNARKMATIKGRGFAELDITLGNDTEELVPSGTQIASYIDTNSSFWAEYIAEGNEEGSDAFPASTGSTTRKSGYLQRLSYEQAATVVAYDGNGDYILTVPATGSGLQTTMRYSEFAADRTYFDLDNGDFILDGLTREDLAGQGFTGFNGGDSDFGIVSKRFLYGPNVTPTAIPIRGQLVIGAYPVPIFDFVDQEGSIAVAVTNAGAVSSVDVDGNDDGLYLIPPTVTIAAPPAGGTQAVAVAVLESNTTAGELREIDHFTVTAAGSGYTSAPGVTVIRRTSGITGTVRQEVADGGLSAAVRVIDGGFGFSAANSGAAGPFANLGEWTGLDPHFAVPSGFTGTAPTLNFTYDFDVANGASFDIVARIDVTAGGSDWTAGDLTTVNGTPFIYVINDAQFPQVDTDGDFLFVTTGSSLAFNTAFGAGVNDINGTPGALVGNTFDLTAGVIASGLSRGSGYVFVPQVNLQNVVGGIGASMTCVVDNTGMLSSITLVGGSGFTLAQANAVTVQVVDPSNALDAEFFLGGSGIQAYNVTNAQNDTYMDEVLSVATSNDFNSVPETNLKRTDNNAENSNTFVALAALPIGPGGGTESARAYGYPYWSGNQKQVIGIELFSAGNGYDAVGQDFSWELSPVYGNETGMNVSAKSTVTAEQLAISITNGGSGYATPPQVIIVGGNVNLGDAMAPQSDDFVFWVNRQGTLVKVDNGYNARVGANFPYTAAGVAADPLEASISIKESEDVITNTFYLSIFEQARFATGGYMLTAGSDSPTNDDGAFDIVLNNNSSLNSWDLTGFGFPTVKENFEVLADGEFVAFGLFGPVASATGIDPMNSGVDYKDGVGNTISVYSYAVTPTFTIVDLAEFGSGATGVVTLDQTDGQIDGITVTNGGSGYFQVYNTNSFYISAEGFRVLGGPDGNVNGAFEVYSGVSYARDIHYGTGQELE